MLRLSVVTAVLGLAIGLAAAESALCQAVSPGEPTLRLVVNFPHQRWSTAVVARGDARLVRPSTDGSVQPGDPRASRSWMARNPALFGTGNGAVGGAAIGATAVRDSGSAESFCGRDALVAFDGGAGAWGGALVGWFVGVSR